jgi:hypothetical protein
MTIGEFFTVKGVEDDVKHEFKLTCLKRKERIGHTVANLMIGYIAKAGFETGLWKGFERVKWSEASVGQEVWLAEAKIGKPVVYGPHTVVDVKGRLLRNVLGTLFEQHQEIILRRLK